MVQNVLSFFQRIENNIWGNQLISNKYYASFSIILVAFIGAMVTGGKILNSTFDLDIEVSFYSAITIIFFITALNIYESIIATDNVKIAMLRALLVFGFIIASFFFGILTSVIIAIIIAIVVVIITFVFILKIALSAGSRQKAQLRSNDIIDFVSGTNKKEGELSADGLTFYEKGGKRWRRDSTLSEDWYED